MSNTNIFKFLNVRLPKKVSQQNLDNSFVSYKSQTESAFIKQIKNYALKDKYVYSLKLAKLYIDTNISLIENLPMVSDKLIEFFKRTDSREISKENLSDLNIQIISSENKVKETGNDEKSKTKEEEKGNESTNEKSKSENEQEKWMENFIDTTDEMEKLWNLFYAMCLIPALFPEKREKLYDYLRYQKFEERIKKGEKLSFRDFKNIKVIVPKELFSQPQPTKLDDKEKKEFEENCVKQLIEVCDKVKKIDNAIIEIRNNEAEYRLIESRKINEKNALNKNNKKKVQISYEVPEPENWLDIDSEIEKLSEDTKTLLIDLKNTGPFKEVQSVLKRFESDVYYNIRNYIHSLTPLKKNVVSQKPEYDKLLQRTPMPAKMNFSTSGSGNAYSSVSAPILPTSDSALVRGIKSVGIGDLKVVRQEFKEYRLGEIAHIENILASEIRERKHSTLHETETTFTIETETEEEKQKDLQTTDRFELQKESEKTINNEMKIDAGFAISGSYGPVVAETHGNFAISQASSTSEKTASNFAKEVVDRSVTKIMNRSREERKVRTLDRIKEFNSHAFNNSAASSKNITGIYRWVDKYYKAQIVNYGKRLMIELIVPEPAAFYKYSQGYLPTTNLNISKPEPPQIVTESIRLPFGFQISESIMPLKPEHLNNNNYLDFVAQYNVQDVEPCPPDELLLNFAIAGETAGQDGFIGTVVEKLVVPDDYVCTRVRGRARHTARVKSVTDSWILYYYLQILVGSMSFRTEVFTENLNGGTYIDTGEGWNFSGTIPVSINGFCADYNVNLRAVCKLTELGIRKWQIKTFQAIMNAYENELAKYNESVAASQIFNGPNITGKNPDTNRRIEQDELKRAALRMLTNDYAVTRVNQFDASGNLVSELELHNNVFDAMNDGTDTAIPKFDILKAIQDGVIMQYFEQAFEWENITYRFYPYFYGREKNWVEAINTVDADPLFAEFLKAGSARILVPVRPAYNDAVKLYIGTNIIWNGGSVPEVGDNLFVSIAQELLEQTDKDFDNLPSCEIDDSGPCIEGQPWEVKLPTSLVYLQEKPDLNP